MTQAEIDQLEQKVVAEVVAFARQLGPATRARIIGALVADALSGPAPADAHRPTNDRRLCRPQSTEGHNGQRNRNELD
jgi:hypothetical protein